MNRILRILVVLPAILFFVIGVRWVVDPAGVAAQLGFSLSTGIGLSSQIGDMSGYFLTMSICMLMAVITGHRIWYYPPIMMLVLTALARVLAWAAHDAALAVRMIAVEVVVSVILITASRLLPKAREDVRSIESDQ